jgi:hypothetical protein
VGRVTALEGLAAGAGGLAGHDGLSVSIPASGRGGYVVHRAPLLVVDDLPDEEGFGAAATADLFVPATDQETTRRPQIPAQGTGVQPGTSKWRTP